MTVSLNTTQVYAGPSTAGAIVAPTINLGTGLGVPASMAGTYSSNSIFGGDTTTAVTAYCGYRVVNTMDLSTRSFVGFSAAQANLSRSAMETWANGGMRIVFQDGSGNWSAFNVYGNGLGNPFGPGSTGTYGEFLGFATFSEAESANWWLDRSKTPVASSGTLNWANITAFEIHFRPASSGRMVSAVGRFMTADLPVHTGTASANGLLVDFRDQLGSTSGGAWPTAWWVRRVPEFLRSSFQSPWSQQLGFQIGDGSTTTTTVLSNSSLILWALPEDDSATLEVPNGVIMFATPRMFTFNQSATDNCSFSDVLISTTQKWGLQVLGSTSGICTFTRCNFVKFDVFTAAHASYTDCIWDGGTSSVDITSNTTITRGTIRNGTKGIKITTGAGSYGSTITFNNNSTYDIECGSGGAGTYNLANISVVGSYVLKIRNNSATNAITVAIPAGISYTTSTAGGTIAVSTPPTYQAVTVSGLVAGSRVQIYDASVSAPVGSRELFNGVVAGTSTTWTDTLPAVANRTIRVRIAKVSGTTAYTFIEATIGTCGTGTTDNTVSYLANQVLDTTYNNNAVDGSTVTGITFVDSGSADRVDCAIAGGATTWKNIYAAFVYWESTATGIANDFTYISAPDIGNYLLSSMKVRNTSATPLTITGGYGRDLTTGLSKDIVDTAGSTGNIFLSPDHVTTYQTTGSYAITGDPSSVAAAVLSAAAAAPIYADIRKVNAVTVRGTGAVGSEWGP